MPESFDQRARRLATALFGEVLLLPGVKGLLFRQFHPDKPGLNEAERDACIAAMQMIRAAYDGLETRIAATVH